MSLNTKKVHMAAVRLIDNDFAVETENLKDSKPKLDWFYFENLFLNYLANKLNDIACL